MAREGTYTGIHGQPLTYDRTQCEGGTWLRAANAIIDSVRHFIPTDIYNLVTDRVWFESGAMGNNFGPGSWAYQRFTYGTVDDDPYHVGHTSGINASPPPGRNSCLP